MAIIAMPSAPPASSMSLQLVRGDSTLEHFDGSVSVVQSTKAVWVLSVSFAVLDISEARAWTAWLAQVAKPANQFEITPPGWRNADGYTGTPLVNGASQLGTTLNVDGVSPGSAQMGNAGDFFSVNGEFKILTANAQASAGAETLSFEPALRQSPANNAPVEFQDPIITMRLVTPQAGWSVSLPEFYNIEFQGVEHFGP